MNGLKNTLNYLTGHAASVKNSFKVGDVLRVVYEDFGNYDENAKVRQFTGICMSRVNREGYLSYTLRNVHNNLPVEFAFDLNSPLVISLLKAPKFKKVSSRRAKLYYLRNLGISVSRV